MNPLRPSSQLFELRGFKSFAKHTRPDAHFFHHIPIFVTRRVFFMIRFRRCSCPGVESSTGGVADWPASCSLPQCLQNGHRGGGAGGIGSGCAPCCSCGVCAHCIWYIPAYGCTVVDECSAEDSMNFTIYCRMESEAHD